MVLLFKVLNIFRLEQRLQSNNTQVPNATTQSSGSCADLLPSYLSYETGTKPHGSPHIPMNQSLIEGPASIFQWSSTQPWGFIFFVVLGSVLGLYYWLSRHQSSVYRTQENPAQARDKFMEVRTISLSKGRKHPNRAKKSRAHRISTSETKP